MSIYVDGNNALVPEPELDEERERKARKRREAIRARQEQKVQSQMRIVRFAAAVAAVIVVMAVAVVMLSAVVKNNSLTAQINRMETQLSELTAQNDSKEYDINRSVNMNTVMKVAEEMGMIRGNASQIVTYENADSEYIQQVAAIPQE